MQQKIALIINSTRKLNASTRHCLALLAKDENFNCEQLFTQEAKHAVRLAKEAIDDGFNCIVAVGGDGTCNEVVNGILLSEKANKVSFGIIPNGTGNDFIKTLGEFEVENFISAIKNQSNKLIDVIQVNAANESIYALNIAGIGFDGYVVQVLNKMRKSILLKGKLAYALAILRSFISYKKTMVTIQSDGFEYSGKMLLNAVCNGKAFGHGLFINPKAELGDNLLGITLLGNVSFFEYIKNIGKLKRSELIIHPEVHYLKSKTISIKSTENSLYTEVDGELFGSGDMKFRVVPNALRILSK